MEAGKKLKSFSENDLQDIEETIKNCEKNTNLDIVPIIVSRSGKYIEINYILGLLLMFLFFPIYSLLLSKYFIFNKNFFPVILLIVFFFGYQLANIDFIKYLFLNKTRKIYKVNLRAFIEFFKHGLYKTKKRNAILIFYSEFENTVEILADEGIHSQENKSKWQTIIENEIKKIKSKTKTEFLKNIIIEVSKNISTINHDSQPIDNFPEKVITKK